MMVKKGIVSKTFDVIIFAKESTGMKIELNGTLMLS